MATYLTPPASPSTSRWTPQPTPGYGQRRNLPKGELTVTPTLSPLSQFASVLSPLLGSVFPASPITPFARAPPSPLANGFATAVQRDKASPPSSPVRLTNRTPSTATAAGKRTRTRTRTRARRLLLIVIVLLAFGSVINNFLSGVTRMLTRQRRRYKAVKAAAGHGSREYVRTGRHPVRSHLERAHAAWAALVRGQSTDAEGAVAEYYRRYAREPPEGYAEWFDHARANGVLLPDEYDGLMDSLEPFWALPPSELRRRTRELAVLPSFSLVTLSKTDAIAVASPEWDATASAGRALAHVLSKVIGRPGVEAMSFAVNEADVSRVIVPWEEAERLVDILANGPNATLPQRAPKLDWPNPLWEGDGAVWSTFARACPPSSPARRAHTTLSAGMDSGHNLESGRSEWRLSHGGQDLGRRRPRGRRRTASAHEAHPTAASLFEALDSPHFAFPSAPGFESPLSSLCQHPGLHDQHAIFFSDYRVLDDLFPVFSTGKVDGYADILVPPLPMRAPSQTGEHARAQQDTFGRWITHPTSEVPWDARDNRFYWRGQLSGEAQSPPGYELNFARPRLLRKTATTAIATVAATQDVVAHTSSSRQLAVVRSHTASLNKRTTNVALTGLRGCGSARACATIEGGEGYAFADPEASRAGMRRAKVVLDVDGEGESLSRYLDILDAGAVAVRGSVFRDAFSDQTMPWVHYLPLSPDFHELHHLHAYFLGPAVDTTSVSLTAAADRRAAASPQTAKLKHSAHHEGTTALRRVAEAGQTWRKRQARPIDAEVYVYRLAIEWSRLWSRTDEEYWASAAAIQGR